MEDLRNDLLDIQQLFLSFEERKEKIHWITNIIKESSDILNIGCHQGYDTLSLSRYLKPNKIFGIDKDENAIIWANNKNKNLLREIDKFERYLESGNSENIELIRQLIQEFELFKIPRYINGDITTEIDIDNELFDLIYCERVLYQLYFDLKGNIVEIPLQRAISNMVRLLKNDGLIIAIEPDRFNINTSIITNIGKYFLAENLSEVQCNYIPKIESRFIYLYKKK